MMNIRRYGLALSSLALGTGILIACGDDDALILATATDSGAVDSSSSRDVSSEDNVAPAPSDSGSDSSDAEPVMDAGRDAQADVDIPPVDAGSPDADAGDLAREFPGRVAAEICRTTARCCFGDANTPGDGGVDGGHYNAQKCFDTYFPNGFDQSNPGFGVDYNKLVYDPTKAAECLGRIQVLACGANAAEYRAVIGACYAALRGTSGAATPCAVTSECAPGFFCNTSGGGVCEALRTTGAACGDWTTNAGQAQYACSNRYSGNPPRYCAFRNDAGTLLPAASWACNDALPIGSRCSNDAWCDNSTVCAPNSAGGGQSCQGFITLFAAPSCSAFISP